MAIEVTMPQMGESVVEGTIAKWLVKEGDVVIEDQPLVEISTDKVDTEIPSPGAGRIAKIVAAEGQTLAGRCDARRYRAGRCGRGSGKIESRRAKAAPKPEAVAEKPALKSVPPPPSVAAGASAANRAGSSADQAAGAGLREAEPDSGGAAAVFAGGAENGCRRRNRFEPRAGDGIRRTRQQARLAALPRFVAQNAERRIAGADQRQLRKAVRVRRRLRRRRPRRQRRLYPGRGSSRPFISRSRAISSSRSRGGAS